MCMSQISTLQILVLINYRIPDPSHDLNEMKVHWVGEKSWSYRCKFSAPEHADGDRIALVFEGLDTFAKVQLNGSNILQSDNMFIPHHVDITPLLNFNTPNTLEIVFDSALLRARDIRREHPEHNYIGHLGEVERLGGEKS